MASRSTSAVISIYPVVIIALLMLSFITLAPQDVRAAAAQTYAFKINANITIVSTIALGENRIALIGNANATAVIQVLDVSDPTSGPKPEFTYPLTGSVTAVATDGWPLTRIAVGTDKGELVLFKVDGGRLYKMLHYIQGADFHILDIVIMKYGNAYKIAALVDEVGGGATSQMTRYVYVFDESKTSVIRIGPVIGNATESRYENVMPVGISAVLAIDNNRYYYDAAKFLMVWTPVNYTMVTLKILYPSNETLVPASRAAIKVVAYNKTLGTIYIYGANADEEGTAHIVIPLKHQANITVYDSYYNEYTIHYDPREGLIEPVIVVLSAPPLTLSGEELYGKLEIFKPEVTILDLRAAPESYDVIGNLTLDLGPEVTKVFVAKPLASTEINYIAGYIRDEKYVIGGEEKEYRVVKIVELDANMEAVRAVIDYVGKNTEIKDLFTYPNGRYLIIGLEDGRVKTYLWNGIEYELDQEYILPGKLLRIKAMPLATGYRYMAYSEGGLQILTIEPMQFPYLRTEFSLGYSLTGAVSGDMTDDLSLGVVGGGNEAIIMKGLDNYVTSDIVEPLDIWEIMLPKLIVEVAVPEGEERAGIEVALSYGATTLTRKTDENGIVEFQNVIPGSSYSLSVKPIQEYLTKYSSSVYIPDFSDLYVNVSLTYRTFTLTLNIRDEFYKPPMGAYNVLVDGEPVIMNSTEPVQSITLIYGQHNITLSPTEEYSYLYEPVEISIFIDKDTSVDITLERMRFNVNLELLDNITNEVITETFIILINGTSYTTENGTLKAILPAGAYDIKIVPPEALQRKYSGVTDTFYIRGDTFVQLIIPRRYYYVTLILQDEITLDTPKASFTISLDREVIGENISATIQFKAYYGTHLVEIAPLPQYSAIYNVHSEQIDVEGNQTITVRLRRTIYRITLVINDPYSRTPAAPLLVYVNDTQYALVLPGESTIDLLLPYSTYVLRVEPVEGYETIYKLVTKTINATSNLHVTINLVRREYELSVNIYDATIGSLIGKFDIYVNGTPIAEEVMVKANVTLPYGTYLLKVAPSAGYEAAYVPAEGIIVELHNDTSIKVGVRRMFYNLNLYVFDDTGTPITDAEISIRSLETGSIIVQLITDEEGYATTALYYGNFEVDVAYGGYYGVTRSIVLDGEHTLKITLNPLPLTIIFRFLPVIIVATVAVVMAAVVLKLRAKIAERLSTAEEVF